MITTTQKKAFLALCVIASMMMIANMTGSFLAYIYDSYPDISPTNVQLVMTLPGLVGLLVSFAVGPLALKFNKKYLLLLTALANFISIMAFAVFGVSGPFAVLLVAAGFSGITRGAAMALINSSIGEYIGAEKSASYIAINAAIMNGGSALVGVIGSVIGSASGGAHWNRAFYLGLLIIPTMIAFAIMMSKAPEAPSLPSDGHGGDATRSKMKDAGASGREERDSKIPGRVFVIIVLSMLFSMSFAAFVLNLSTYIITEYRLGTSTDVGLINSVATVVGIIIGFSYTLWSKLFKKWIVPIGYAVAAIGMIVTPKSKCAKRATGRFLRTAGEVIENFGGMFR